MQTMSVQTSMILKVFTSRLKVVIAVDTVKFFFYRDVFRLVKLEYITLVNLSCYFLQP